ncbi:MAG: putative phage abortive infection protein [Bacteroidota bacterium]
MFVNTSDEILRETEKTPKHKISLIKEESVKYDHQKEVKKITRIAIGIAIVMILLWIAPWVFSSILVGTSQELSLFVDMFFSVHTLFIGLALAGVVYTLLLQRIEIKHNTFELTAQKLQFKKQNSILQLQKFESSFFQLLSFHNKLHDTVQYYCEGRTLDGTEAFEEIRIDIRRQTINPLKNTDDYTNNVFQNARGLRNYFNNLYNIIKFIHEDSIIEKDKYMSIFRSQLSASEQVLLFYDCSGNADSKKFKSLVEEYALFENLDCGLLLHYHHSNQYDIKAFGSTPPPK